MAHYNSFLIKNSLKNLRSFAFILCIMSTAKTGFVELHDACSVIEALRKYSGNKAWSTRYVNEVAKSQPLLDKAYDRRTDKIVLENIRKAENEVAAMGMIVEFFMQKKYEKAKDHLDEVEELEENT